MWKLRLTFFIFVFHILSACCAEWVFRYFSKWMVEKVPFYATVHSVLNPWQWRANMLVHICSVSDSGQRYVGIQGLLCWVQVKSGWLRRKWGISCSSPMQILLKISKSCVVADMFPQKHLSVHCWAEGRSMVCVLRAVSDTQAHPCAYCGPGEGQNIFDFFNTGSIFWACISKIEAWILWEKCSKKPIGIEHHTSPKP